jgi:hypothetical protein
METIKNAVLNDILDSISIGKKFSFDFCELFFSEEKYRKILLEGLDSLSIQEIREEVKVHSKIVNRAKRTEVVTKESVERTEKALFEFGDLNGYRNIIKVIRNAE